MKISEKKSAAAYSAISDSIMKLRIEIQQGGCPDSSTMDAKLFRLEHDIWCRLHKALNMEPPHD